MRPALCAGCIGRRARSTRETFVRRALYAVVLAAIASHLTNTFQHLYVWKHFLHTLGLQASQRINPQIDITAGYMAAGIIYGLSRARKHMPTFVWSLPLAAWIFYGFTSSLVSAAKWYLTHLRTNHTWTRLCNTYHWHPDTWVSIAAHSFHTTPLFWILPLAGLPVYLILQLIGGAMIGALTFPLLIAKEISEIRRLHILSTEAQCMVIQTHPTMLLTAVPAQAPKSLSLEPRRLWKGIP
jgi:hypothetical protein